MSGRGGDGTKRARAVPRRSALAIGAGFVGLVGSGGLIGSDAAARGVGRAPLGTPALIIRHPAVRAGYQFLDTAMDAYPAYGPVRLPQSYADQAGLYSTAYTCDAALAALAYLAEGSPERLERARLIGEAFRFAQEHDPGFRDGRLRQSYTVGPYLHDRVEQPNGFIQPDGMVNAGNAYDHSASYAGDAAWAGLALLALGRRGLGAGFLPAAVRLGTWVVDTCSSTAPLGGFRAGVSRAGTPLSRTDTAANAALVTFFGRLAAATGDPVWTERRANAASFVRRMWLAEGGFYASGSDDGRVVARFPVTAEAQTSAVLALDDGPHPANGSAVNWVVAELGVTDTAEAVNSVLPPGTSVSGVTFSDRSRLVDPTTPIEPGLPRPDPDAVWLGGDAQLAAALLARGAPGDLEAAHARLNTLAEAQAQLPGQLSPGGKTTLGGKLLPAGIGLVAASSPLHTGVTDSGFYPARHVGTTAWYLLAVLGVNPYAPTSRQP